MTWTSSPFSPSTLILYEGFEYFSFNNLPYSPLKFNLTVIGSPALAITGVGVKSEFSSET